MTFREKLIALRRRDRLTQTALAKAVGVTRQSVYMWEKGTSYPEAETLLSLRRLFGVSIDVLLDEALPLPDGENGAAPAAASPARQTAQEKTEFARSAGRSAQEIAKTPSEKSENAGPATKIDADLPPAEEPEQETRSAPLRAKVDASRVKSGNILDLFGSFLKRKK